ncbi:MAG: hypothetical protein AVDCRST_MAG56-1216 [uncultured Cytophagales bacterium]|uniref:Uncharacterized protein n=1 Tax=uncultured Cytophagales bacterium TaxID=158755 RepID=A0A6J4HXL3_9SPHI|nr:MAG: hypothetical protein AVDCRST_MAG56-1216 [uncultured Cytophagales bacterium]
MVVRGKRYVVCRGTGFRAHPVTFALQKYDSCFTFVKYLPFGGVLTFWLETLVVKRKK